MRIIHRFNFKIVSSFFSLIARMKLRCVYITFRWIDRSSIKIKCITTHISVMFLTHTKNQIQKILIGNFSLLRLEIKNYTHPIRNCYLNAERYKCACSQKSKSKMIKTLGLLLCFIHFIFRISIFTKITSTLYGYYKYFGCIDKLF